MIAIIAILAAILFPVFARAKEAAKVTTGLSDAKQVDLGVLMYMTDVDDALPLGGVISRSMDSPSIGTSEWQEATYKYVKNEGVYHDPDDPTTLTRTFLDQSDCANRVSRDVTHLSASSFLTNYNITDVVINPDGTVGRTSPSEGAYSAPASFILLMNGQRPVVGGSGTGLRYIANPPDHNGDTCSAWLAIYSQTDEAGANHLLNPLKDPNGSTVPHHKGGELFGFLDGHVKFCAVDTSSPNSYLQMEGRYPWCTNGRRQSQDPTCIAQGLTWHINDAF